MQKISKELKAHRLSEKKKRDARFKRRMKATGEIELLQYKTIERDFFEVFATTWRDKISFEGNMCGGLLKKFIKEVIAGGGKVEKVKHALVDKEVKEELRQANAELRGLYKRISSAARILKLKRKD